MWNAIMINRGEIALVIVYQLLLFENWFCDDQITTIQHLSLVLAWKLLFAVSIYHEFMFSYEIKDSKVSIPSFKEEQKEIIKEPRTRS